MSNFIDKLFRKKLQNRSFKPQAGDWAAMDGLLNSEFNTPPPSSSISIKWIFISAISIIIAVGAIVGIQQQSEIKTSNRDINSSKKSINSTSNTDNNKSEKDYPLQSPDQNKTTTNTSLPITSSSNTSTYDDVENESNKDASPSNYENNSLSESSSINSPSSELNNEIRDESRNENSKKKIDPNQNLVVSANSLANTNALSASSKTDNTSYYEEENPKQNNVGSVKYDDNSDWSSYQKHENSNSYSSLDQNNSPNKKAFDNAEATLLIPNYLSLNSQAIQSIPYSGSNKSIQELSKDDSPVQKTKAIKVKRSLPIQLSIAAFGEVSYISKSIKGDSEYSSLIDIRNSQEKNIIASGGGLEVQAKYKGLGFSTGIILNKWGENIQYEEKYTSEWDVSSETIVDTLWTEDIVYTIDTIWADSSYFIIIDSSLTTVVDTIQINTIYDSTETITEAGLANENGKTTIQYWEIPLYFSYQFDLGDFYITPGLGVSIGFLKITKGYYMAENLESLIAINTGYSVIKKTLFNGMINLGVGYRLSDKFSLEATPSFKFNLTNIFENPGMIQRYSRLSLQFRLRYYF